jgi:dsRNA-specific ribonuclease
MPKQRIPVKPATDLEKELGYEFKEKELLRRALTHQSAINENHPQASNRDLSSLAFVGDAVLKYAVARYLFRCGHDHITMKPVALHKATQAYIKNSVLAAIGNKKLHLGEYLVRGNTPTTPTENMYADCVEAILGAIALDFGNDQQHLILNVIETLCSGNIEKWLKDTHPEKIVHKVLNQKLSGSSKIFLIGLMLNCKNCKQRYITLEWLRRHLREATYKD